MTSPRVLIALTDIFAVLFHSDKLFCENTLVRSLSSINIVTGLEHVGILKSICHVKYVINHSPRMYRSDIKLIILQLHMHTWWIIEPLLI